jgi:hypothetical protein
MTSTTHACACGYRAESLDDLEEHILAMARLADQTDHAEGRQR